MSALAESKKERLHLRIDANSKRKLERAASYAETSTSQFVLRNALDAADRMIESHERIVLGQKDWDDFYDALMNPPEPNDALKRAAARYRERMSR
ncbi:MAG: DUF1778 domain-containing protein [Gammaproteobacteria bacterium]|nr:DUF1778 domain-containing protein [Gammaproteobacteria bacterium]